MERSAYQAIRAVLKRGPKKGLNAVTIAERANVKVSTTRTVLSALQSEGTAKVAGKEKAEGRGRPANLYIAV